MTHPYEILFRWSDDGQFSGAHTVRRDSVTGAVLPAMPLGQDTEFPIPEVISNVNAALCSKNSELTSALDEMNQSALAAASQARETVESQKAIIDRQAKEISDLKEALRIASIPAIQARREQLLSELAELAALG